MMHAQNEKEYLQRDRNYEKEPNINSGSEITQ